MLVPITALYAGLIALLTLYLMLMVGAYRGKAKLSLGDGGDEEMIIRVRRHGNLVESAAIVLVLMAIIELNGAGSLVVHGIGLLYLIARLAHPIGLRAGNTSGLPRIVGAFGTLIVLLVGAGFAIWQYVQAMTAG